MSKELDELKKRMNSIKERLDCDIKFEEYSKVYSRSNENLKEYVKDLEGKKVLCVASSGDHLLNAVYAGAKEVDTFDINRYAPLYQELNMYAIKYLKPVDAYAFLCLFYPNIDWKFNEKLEPHVKEFFDYLFSNYSFDQIQLKLFCEFNSSIENCNFNSIDALKELKSKLKHIKYKHMHCNLASIFSFTQDKYDAIYLSNILEYEKNLNKYFDIVRRLKDFHLNEGGTIYYNYIWGKSPDENIRYCYKYDKNNYITYEDQVLNKDIIDNTRRIVIPSIFTNYRNEDGILLPDIVLAIDKKSKIKER